MTRLICAICLVGSVSPAGAAMQDGRPTAALPAAPALTPLELSLWRDPEFQRQFTQSYIAETEIEPRITESERDQMQKVLDLMKDEKVDRAVALLGRHRGPAASAVFDFTLAGIHFQREEFAEAQADYRIAVEKHPRFRRAWRNLGLVCIRRGDFESALPALARVVELGGGDAITYGLLGLSYARTEDHLAAETAFRMANLLDPDTLDWKLGLARSFFLQQRFADAVALCGQLITEQPDRADLWLLQANAFIGLNQPLRAAENYELVDRLGRSTPGSLTMLGDIYINEELFDLGVASYLRALEMSDQGDPARALRAAKVLTARGALAETRRLVEGIERLAGDALASDQRKDLLKLRARIAVAEGAGDEEARVLREIVELDPLDGEALILLGQHAARTGDIETAAFYYERAAALEKFEADANVRHAQLLVGVGRYDDALPMLRRAQALNPRDNIQQYLDQVERVARAR